MILFNPLALLPLAKKAMGYFGKKRDQKHTWEITQAKRSSTALRILSFITIWGPLYHGYYLAMTTAPIETPEDVADAISAVFNAFPQWWTGAAVMILLAVWGIREKADIDLGKSVARRRERETEAEVEKAKGDLAVRR